MASRPLLCGQRSKVSEVVMCLSLSQTGLYISCLVGLSPSGRLHLVTKGSCSQYAVLLRLRCPTTRRDSLPPRQLFRVYSCAQLQPQNWYIWHNQKKNSFTWAQKSMLSIYSNISEILAMWIGDGLVFKNKWNIKSIGISISLAWRNKQWRQKKGEMHIFVTFEEQWPSGSTMCKATPVKSVCRGQADAFPGAGMVSSRSIVPSKHGFVDGGRRGVAIVINWNVGPVWLNGSPFWAGRRRAEGFGPDWWAAHLSRPASGCQGQQPGGYRGRGACRRAAAPTVPGEQASTLMYYIHQCKYWSTNFIICKPCMTNALN